MHLKDQNNRKKLIAKNKNKLFKDEKLLNKFTKYREIKQLNSDNKTAKNRKPINNKNELSKIVNSY